MSSQTPSGSKRLQLRRTLPPPLPRIDPTTAYVRTVTIGAMPTRSHTDAADRVKDVLTHVSLTMPSIQFETETEDRELFTTYDMGGRDTAQRVVIRRTHVIRADLMEYQASHAGHILLSVGMQIAQPGMVGLADSVLSWLWEEEHGMHAQSVWVSLEGIHPKIFVVYGMPGGTYGAVVIGRTSTCHIFRLEKASSVPLDKQLKLAYATFEAL